VVEGERENPEDCPRALDEVVRHMDEAGEPPATHLGQRWQSEWRHGTGRCPTCGNADVDHNG